MAAVLDTTVYCSSQQSRWRCARCGDDATTFVATVQQAFVLAMAQPDNKAAVASYDTLLNGLLHFGEHNMRRCVLQCSPKHQIAVLNVWSILHRCMLHIFLQAYQTGNCHCRAVSPSA